MTANKSQYVNWSVIVPNYIEWLNRYILTGNLHGQWKVIALSQVYKNLRIPSSENEKCSSALQQYCSLYRMYIICRYSYSYSYSSTSTCTRTRTHAIIKYSYSYLYSHILQVLVHVLVLVNLVLAPALVCCHNAFGLQQTVRQIPRPSGRGILCTIRTSLNASWQQTPTEPVLIP